MKKLLLLVMTFVILSCSKDDDTQNRSDHKLLPSMISFTNSTFHNPPSIYEWELRYDDNDRLIKYGNTDISYENSSRISIGEDMFTVDDNKVYMNGELLMELGSNGMPSRVYSFYKRFYTDYGYDKYGNIKYYIYHPWNDERTSQIDLTSDDKNAPLRFVNSPPWFLMYLFTDRLGYNNNPVLEMDLYGEIPAGYEYEIEYNDYDYPTSIQIKAFGILGVGSKEYKFRY